MVDKGMEVIENLPQVLTYQVDRAGIEPATKGFSGRKTAGMPSCGDDVNHISA
jgi:hypothetical protein